VGGARLLARATPERVAALRLAVGAPVWLIVSDASRCAPDPSA
jgi:hypothetical protein